MNVILTIGYDRYLTSIEDAAKIMALLGKAKRVDMVYGYEAEGTAKRVDMVYGYEAEGTAKRVDMVYGYEAEGTAKRYVIKDDALCNISAVTYPIADA